MLMMALNLIEMGHHVTIFTSFYDPNRSFKESKDKRINLHVIGHDIPANINGKLTVLMTLIKLFCLSYCVPKESYDFIITDMHPFPLLFFKIRDIFSFKLQKVILRIIKHIYSRNIYFTVISLTNCCVRIERAF